MQIAPHTTACNFSTLVQECMVARIEVKGEWQPWGTMPLSAIQGFTYESGYSYDLSVQTICNRAAVGEFFPLSRSLKSINSKTPSTDVISNIPGQIYWYC